MNWGQKKIRNNQDYKKEKRNTYELQLMKLNAEQTTQIWGFRKLNGETLSWKNRDIEITQD